MPTGNRQIHRRVDERRERRNREMEELIFRDFARGFFLRFKGSIFLKLKKDPFETNINISFSFLSRKKQSNFVSTLCFFHMSY